MYRKLLPLLLLVLNADVWAGDPTRPIWGTQGNSSAAAKLSTGLDTLRLQQIVHRDGGTSVVINNKLYQVGDAIAGYRISRVQRNRVFLLDRQDKISILALADHVSGIVARETE